MQFFDDAERVLIGISDGFKKTLGRPLKEYFQTYELVKTILVQLKPAYNNSISILRLILKILTLTEL